MPLAAGPAIDVIDAEEALGIGIGTDILIVDDDPANLVAYEAALSPLGRRVVLARSGIDALARLLEQDFALMLLDVAMPDMSGIETARLARQRPRNQGMPIVFITGASTDVMLEAYEAGAFDFVAKPVLPEVLRAKVRIYLQLQERTQALLGRARSRVAPARRLEWLQQVTAALSRAMTPVDIARAIVGIGTDAVGAAAAAVWLATPEGTLELAASHGAADDYLRAELPARRAFQSRTAIWLEAEVALPITNNEDVRGIVAFAYAPGHRFDDDERAFLATIVGTCEQAHDRARLYAAESEARRLAEALNDRKDEYLAMLGHELRNPLAAMVSAIELITLRDGSLGRELGLFRDHLSRLTRIVNDLVDVSRLSHGRIALQRESVGVARAIADAIDRLATMLVKRGHQLDIDVAPGLAVDADRERFVQVVTNLVANAATFTRERGRITITGRPAGDSIELVVSDTGIGISPGLLPHVFDAFVQGDQPLDRDTGGLGVGLALVRTIVDLHGGRITASSDGVDRGATFTVRWPVATTQPPTRDSAPLVTTSVLPDLRVLVVDDNEDAAHLFAALLQELGQQVAVAHDGPSALAIAKGISPDVAFLDLGLPGMDGFELAARFREQFPSTVLVALTGYGLPGDRERSERAGFLHHYVKPLDLDGLVDLLVGIRSS